jgi:hypothetical protein
MCLTVYIEALQYRCAALLVGTAPLKLLIAAAAAAAAQCMLDRNCAAHAWSTLCPVSSVRTSTAVNKLTLLRCACNAHTLHIV